MQPTKAKRLFSDFPAVPRESVQELTAAEAGNLRAQVIRKLGVGPSIDGLALVSEMKARGRSVMTANAEAKDFDLLTCLNAARIIPQARSYVNWYQFDQIDRVDLRVLAEHFSYFWYPKADYIDIFDDSMTWFLSIDYDGYPWAVRLP